jgi:hypothetical protein
MGPIPTDKFRRFATKHGWALIRRGRHGEVWMRPGNKRPIVIPDKRETYPSVAHDCLLTMGLSMDDLRTWLASGGR